MEATAEVAVNHDTLNELLGRTLVDIGAAVQAPLMILGSRLGLFEALADGFVTTSELAERTGTTERYVREWVRAQAAAGYVAYDADTDRYALTPEQALVFADRTSPAYLIVGFEQAMIMGARSEQVEESFRTGEGIRWHDHDPNLSCSTARFFEPGYRANLVSGWLPALEGAEEKLRAGARVADVGCGYGISTRLMAEAFPESRFFGFDYHEGSIDAANADARAAGVADRVTFERTTAKDFPGRGYDLITMFDCLHDLGDPVGAAMHAKQALAPDGILMVVEPRAGDRVEENLNPVGRLYYAASTLICTPTSLSQEVGLALGAQAGEAAIRAVLEEAGFTRFRRAAETPFNLVFEARI
ncbi:MAG TPA: class I SAM-dependent methyltransferase [Longimicrobiales bacterium]|nr:class I SAM-dependent methyltransferase [Longimicrobiales bacterium]